MRVARGTGGMEATMATSALNSTEIRASHQLNTMERSNTATHSQLASP